MYFASAWVDTLRQPCDPGTWPSAKGVLSLERPQYMQRRRSRGFSALDWCFGLAGNALRGVFNRHNAAPAKI